MITIGLPRLARRHLLLIPGLGLSLVGNAVAGDHGLGIAPLLLFGILPHVPALFGSKAIPLFNAAHHPAAPVALIAAGSVGLVTPLWFVAGLVWAAHIVVDSALGDGTRAADGSRRAALGA